MLGINADASLRSRARIGFASPPSRARFVAPIYSMNPGMGPRSS